MIAEISNKNGGKSKEHEERNPTLTRKYSGNLQSSPENAK